MTLKEVGAAMNVQESTASLHERQDKRLTLPLLRRYADFYGVTVAEITGEAPTNGARRPSTARPRPTIKRELGDLDQCSIRAIREYICRQKDAPPQLVTIEELAARIRAELRRTN